MISKVEVDQAKEIDDVMVLIVEVVKAVRGKQKYQEVLDEFISAVSGAEGMKEELANKRIAFNTIGGRIGDIYDAFVVVKEEGEEGEEPTEPADGDVPTIPST